MALDTTVKSIWNMDEARLKSLNYYMLSCESALHNWDLKSTHQFLQSIKLVVFPMFKEKERTDLNKELKELETMKRDLDNTTEESKWNANSIKYHNKASEIYLEFGILNVKHGLIFRKGDDTQLAALKR